MRRLIIAAENRALRTYNFLADLWYYLGQGYSLRRALELTRNTL